MLLEATTTQTTILREISADLETPISVYMKVRGQGASFLLESVEGGERIARYSFIGIKPKAQYIIRGNEIEIVEAGSSRVVKFEDKVDPTYFLQDEVSRFKFVPQAGAPRFIGGLVGYLGYESVRHFEPTLKPQMKQAPIPDGIYLLADTVIAFDHARRSLSLIANVLDGDVDAAHRKLDEIESCIQQPLPVAGPRDVKSSKTRSNMTQGRFEDMVRDAKEYIAAGDIFQVVLAQRFEAPFALPPFTLYRALRRVNPSPYLFFLDLKDFAVAGSSPEILVKVAGGTVTIRPIAGTRPRGNSPHQDKALEIELLADPKERAEHLMLLDLGRNDVGRVAQMGTVRVTDQFFIERYSQVMHIVSNVEGRLDDGRDAIDALAAGFPAGTVSGAPKVRAMEIIDELEKEKRGIYAGAVGYFSAGGDMDTCIVLRTALVKDSMMYVQAGAGIVADSDPKSEQQECVNKAKALFRAAEEAIRFASDA